MWVVMMFTKGGSQYEYTVIPESANPTADEIVTLAMQAHVLNLFSGIVEMRADGSNQLSEIIIMTSLKRFPALVA
jgi:hypothetical protein